MTPAPDQPPSEEGQTTSSSSRNPDEQSLIDGSRLLMDVDYNPLKRIGGQEHHPGDDTFQRRRKQHELDERPLHVRKQEFKAAINWCAEAENDFVYGVEVPMPEDEKAWRKILKNPTKFTAKSVQKGAEISWGKLDGVQRAAMQEAKLAEVDQWVKEEACEKYKGIIPAGRPMRMRWVLTLKSTSDPALAKCKARIVLLGNTDPDLETLQTSAPTLTRRSRQLALGLACSKMWRLLKADAKSAFLQGTASQSTRNIFALPVEELASALGVPQGQAVKVLKAAYGLVSAPREWFLEVNRVATEDCQLRQLKSDWVMDGDGPDAEPRGFITSHLDDFLIDGSETSPKWQACVAKFKKAFRWSPWEEPPFVHCGVVIEQREDFSFQLDHSKYCVERSSRWRLTRMWTASLQKKCPNVEQFLEQLNGGRFKQHPDMLRTYLGFRVLFQTQLPNKLGREIYAQRHLAVHTKQLNVEKLSDLALIC